MNLYAVEDFIKALKERAPDFPLIVEVYNEKGDVVQIKTTILASAHVNRNSTASGSLLDVSLNYQPKKQVLNTKGQVYDFLYKAGASDEALKEFESTKQTSFKRRDEFHEIEEVDGGTQYTTRKVIINDTAVMEVKTEEGVIAISVTESGKQFDVMTTRDRDKAKSDMKAIKEAFPDIPVLRVINTSRYLY